MDSCNARKLDPGFAQMYSKPIDFSTSTMKSEPGRSAVSTSTDGETGPVSSASARADGTAEPGCLAVCWASTGAVPAASAAAPAAAPFRKPRRATEFADFAIAFQLLLAKCDLSLTVFFLFDSWAKQLFEEAFLNQPLHGAVIDHRAEIEALHLRCRLRVNRMIDHVLHGRRQHIRHTFERIGFGVAVVDPPQIGKVFRGVLHIGLQREVLVFIEAFDGFGVRLYKQLGELRICRYCCFAK